MHDLACRFLEDVIAACGLAGCHTLKQFKFLNFEDVEWPEGTKGGKKMFLRMAMNMAAEAPKAAKPTEEGGSAAG